MAEGGLEQAVCCILDGWSRGEGRTMVGGKKEEVVGGRS